MLKRSQRINQNREYNYIYKKGKKLQGRYIIIFVVTEHSGNNRFGIVTSKKVGGAVKRNRVKRQLRAAIQKNQDLIKTGHGLVIVARSNIKDASYALIENDFVNLMKRAHLI